MSNQDTNQAVPKTASATTIVSCGGFDPVDIRMPHDSPSKVLDRTDGFASNLRDDEEDDDKLPELISNATDYDESGANSRQEADNAVVDITSSDTSANTPDDDDEDDEKLPELVAHHEGMPPTEQVDNIEVDLPPLLDDGDSDFNLANLSTNTILVDYGDSDMDVANPSTDIPLVDYEDSDLGVANLSTNTPLVDDANSVLNVANPSLDTPQSDDDDMPDLVPGDEVYDDLPDLVDNRDSAPTFSHIGSTKSGSFVVHDGQRCNRKPTDCDKCKAVLQQQTQQFEQELAAACLKFNERRPELAQKSIPRTAENKLKPKKRGEGGLHIAWSLLFLAVISLKDDSWTAAITALLLWHGLNTIMVGYKEALEQFRLVKDTDHNTIKAVQNQAVDRVFGLVKAINQDLKNFLEKLRFTEGTILERIRSRALDQLKGLDGSGKQKVMIEEVD